MYWTSLGLENVRKYKIYTYFEKADNYQTQKEKGVGNSGECLESEENGEQVVRVEDEL